MLHIIISPNIETRLTKRDKLLEKKSGEVILLDDTITDIVSLKGYVFPSLFSVDTPVVHAKNLIEQFGEQLTKELVVALVSSQTFFILEERTIGAPLLKVIEKEGGVIYKETETKTKPAQATIFGATNALTAQSKKDRWLSYRKAISEHSAEAVVGILYWKLRSLIESSPKNQSFKNLYTALIKAHKESWQKGFALELAIEKVILEQV